jgi:protein SCO1/2
MKNKSYIGISFIVLVFGIWTVKEIKARYFSKAELFEIGSAPRFNLINQDSIAISDVDFKDKVYVVEFFFSTCPTICPKMNENMLKIEKNFLTNNDFGIASITINPANDTPSVLKAHAKHLGVTHKNWHFLTGDKEYIYNLSNKGFNLYASQNNKVMGGFEHSGFFALVDKNGNIRCRKDNMGNPILYYDGLEKEGVKAIIEDINLLLKE